MTSLDPLSMESHECKLGIRRLMEMQMLLKPKSIIAEQGHELMKKLVSLVLAKELDKMLDFAAPASDAHNERAIGQSHHSTLEESNSGARKRPPRADLTEAEALADAASVGDIHAPDGDGLMGSFAPAVTDAASDFHEDSSLAQTLLDFGLTSNGLGISLTNSVGMFNDCFVSQGQDCIWDLNHHSSLQEHPYAKTVNPPMESRVGYDPAD